MSFRTLAKSVSPGQANCTFLRNAPQTIVPTPPITLILSCSWKMTGLYLVATPFYLLKLPETGPVLIHMYGFPCLLIIYFRAQTSSLTASYFLSIQGIQISPLYTKIYSLLPDS